MTSAHFDRIIDVLATKNRELTKQMFREIAGAEPDNKWATKDIAKRVRDIAAAQVDPDPAPTPSPANASGFVPAPLVSDPQVRLEHAHAFAMQPEPPPLHACHPGTTGPCPARASLGKFKGRERAKPMPSFSSPHFSPELIEEIRQRTREDIKKIQADENADLGPVRPLVSPILPPLVTEQSRRFATVTRRTAKTLNPKTENFLGAKAILAALKPGQILTHHYRDPAITACRVEVITPPGLDGKGGVYSYKHAQYKSLRKIAKLDSGQDFNILYFFGLAAWPKHKKQPPAEAVQ